MRVLLRYKEPVCLLLSFAAILLVVTVYGLTHGFDSSATVDHKSPQILQELLPVDTTITRDEAAQFILAGKLCRKVNQPYTSLAQLDRYVKVA